VCATLVATRCSGPRPTNEEFLENLGAAALALKDTLPRVLEFISGKTISEL
jgi:5'-methylthioadenosine nucleosidase